MHALFIDKHKDGILPQVWIIKAAHMRANEVDTHQVACVGTKRTDPFDSAN